MVRESKTDEEIKKINDVDHYTGGEQCQYDCDAIAEFVVKAETTAGGVNFIGCRDCLRSALIYPIENGWVDKRTDQVRNA